MCLGGVSLSVQHCVKTNDAFDLKSRDTQIEKFHTTFFHENNLKETIMVFEVHRIVLNCTVWNTFLLGLLSREGKQSLHPIINMTPLLFFDIC